MSDLILRWTKRTHRPKMDYNSWELWCHFGPYKKYVGKVLDDRTGAQPRIVQEYYEPWSGDLHQVEVVDPVPLENVKSALELQFLLNKEAFVTHWATTQHRGRKKVLTEIRRSLTI